MSSLVVEQRKGEVPIEHLGHWCDMLHEQVMVEISSKRDSPFIEVTTEEEVASMSVLIRFEEEERGAIARIPSSEEAVD